MLLTRQMHCKLLQQRLRDRWHRRSSPLSLYLLQRPYRALESPNSIFQLIKKSPKMQACFSGASPPSLRPSDAALQPKLVKTLRAASCQAFPDANLPKAATGFVNVDGRNRLQARRRVHIKASEDDKDVQYNKEFGYSRKDVLLIGFGIIGFGFALYYTAQAFGVEATTAGNFVQLFIFLVICVGYISTYIIRVANKDMTYAKQLEAYEERVMSKRLEEMPETERERLLQEVEREKAKRQQ